MESIKAIRIEATCLVHATEDINKVRVALTNIIPEETQEKISFKQQKLDGYYGNPIIILRTKVNNIDLVESFLRDLSRAFGEVEKKTFSAEFEKHLDEKGNLYIRLDKQAAFMSKLSLQQEDPIKIKICIKKSKRMSKEQILGFYKRIGLLI